MGYIAKSPETDPEIEDPQDVDFEEEEDWEDDDDDDIGHDD